MEECPVCRDKYSIRIRKPILCPYCKFKCCLSCFRQYLLTSLTEPVCMSCKVQFNYEFLLEQLPTTFWHREYKEFRKEMLLSREESLLPETQNCIMRIRQKEGLYKHVRAYRAKIDKMYRNYNRMMDRVNQMNDLIYQEKTGRIEIPEDHPFFLFFNEDCTPMMNEKKELLCMQDAPDAVRRMRRTSTMSGWVHACPKEDCRGFLRGEQSRCHVCSTKICPQCLIILDDDADHECRKEDVETVDMLKQNTKPCPNCSMSIYKISGCDQMWCTQCRTPFSWRTGQKINQTIHNPHYYEWLQNRGENHEMGRELMDIPCGGLPSARQLELFPSCHRKWVYNLHRMITHFDQVSVPRSQAICDGNENHKMLRISYLLNQISKPEWKNQLYAQEKHRQKHLQYIQILQTFVAVGSDWLRRMVLQMPNNDKVLREELECIHKFVRYIDNQVGNLNKRFKSSLSGIPSHLIASV